MSKRLKIALVSSIYPPRIGGPAPFTESLKKWLDKRGHEVTVITYGKSAQGVIGVHGFTLLGRWRAVRRALDEIKPDVVLVMDPISSGYAVAKSGYPYALRFVGDQPWEIGRELGLTRKPHTEYRKRSPPILAPLRWLQRKTISRADNVITLNPFLAELCKEEGSSQVTVIPNSVERLKAPSRAAARKELGIGAGTALVVGRLVPYKRVDEVIRVVMETGNDLIIVGGGPEEQRLKKLAARLNAGKRVRFIPSVPHNELGKYYRAADVLVVNSEYEGISHTVLEASLLGTPVAAADNPGNRCVLPKRCLYPLGDTRAMKRLILSPCKADPAPPITRDEQFSRYERVLLSLKRSN